MSLWEGDMAKSLMAIGKTRCSRPPAAGTE
ncbi:Uncharacterised protein [Vibrio cholerae]|nr:Uncharacterised protein [Vibrio cholerae]